MKGSGRDVLCLAAVLGVAALLRFWSLTDLGLTHFDEGAYAGTGRWIATAGLEGWAFQAGQSPGLFPVLLGLAFFLFGVQDFVAVGVSAAAGALTAGLLYWIGRNWFGRAAGLAAGLFLATCQYHLIYSRMALTDALFSLFFWASAAAFIKAVESRSGRWFAAAGLLTALAWNTKYHGVLPLALAALFSAADWLLNPPRAWRRGTALSLPRGFALAAAVASLAMTPWIVAVAVTLGWGGVLRGVWEHSAGQAGWIATPPTVLAFFLGRWVGLPLLALALTSLAVEMGRRRKEGVYCAFVSFALLTAAMFYLAFPRLLLPAVVGICLLAGAAVGSLFLTASQARRRIGAAVLTLGVVGSNFAGSLPVLKIKTDAYRRAAAYLENLPQPKLTQMKKNFYFYGALPFAEMRFQSPAHWDAVDRNSAELLVAVDPIVRKLPAVSAWIERRRARLTLIGRFRIEAYEPVFYQGFKPSPGASWEPEAEWIEIFLLWGSSD